MVPVKRELLTGTVPVNKELLTGIVPVNNLFLILIDQNKKSDIDKIDCLIKVEKYFKSKAT